MIVVTGATGHVGTGLVAQLAAAGHRVRAMTRRPETYQAPGGVEVVGGDAGDPASLEAVFDGAERAFLMSAQARGTAAEQPTHVPSLVRAAERAGVRHAVLLSVHSGGGGADVIADWAGRIERAVTDSALSWTLLRPGRFMSNALQWAPQIRAGGEVRIPFARRRAASIDPADVSAVAALALTSGDHHGEAYQMSGPESLTPVEELAVLAELLGRPLRAVEPPLAAVRAGMRSSGVPDDVIEAIIVRAEGTDEGTEVLPAVSALLGRPPRTFRAWAGAHIRRFQ